MRIVYDDYMQDYFDDLLREFMGNLHCNIKCKTEGYEKSCKRRNWRKELCDG